MKKIFEKKYCGFESLYDLERDVQECFDPAFNKEAADIPGEFSGTVTITINYEAAHDDPGKVK